MGLLNCISQWFDGAARLEEEQYEYEDQLEYVKGYLGDNPKEALQKISAREDRYRATFKEIQSLACLARHDDLYTNYSVLRQIENICIHLFNQEEPELTP